MNGLAIRRVMVAGVRIVVGGTFAYAGIVKLSALLTLADSIATFQILPTVLISPLALALPPFEIAIGIWLISGWRRRSAAFSAMMTTGIFLVALVSALIRGIPVDCGCFGASNSAWSPVVRLWLDVGRDLLLLCATLVIYLDACSETAGAGKMTTPTNAVTPAAKETLPG